MYKTLSSKAIIFQVVNKFTFLQISIIFVIFYTKVLHCRLPPKQAWLKFRLLWPCIMNVGWRERNQQDATNLMFIIKLLYEHVSGIIMPIIRRTRVCTAAYGVLHWLWWLWLCGVGTRSVCTVKVTVRLLSQCTQLPSQPSQPVQNTICGSAHSCSSDDGHNDVRNMLR